MSPQEEMTTDLLLRGDFFCVITLEERGFGAAGAGEEWRETANSARRLIQ
jgi:hypothetical protein